MGHMEKEDYKKNHLYSHVENNDTFSTFSGK